MTTAKKPGLGARMGSVAAALAAASTSKPASPAEENGPPVATSLRLPPQTHKDLRKIAYEEDVSIHSLLMEGVAHVLEKRRGKTS